MPTARLYTTKEVAQLTGIHAATLRKWEERYQIVRPQRMPNGYRGYTEQDVELLRWVGAQVAEGAPISRVADEAVERLRGGWTPEVAPPAPVSGAGGLAEYRERLVEHLTGVDERQARHTLDEVFAIFQVETVLREILEPALHEIGRLWQTGAISEYQEHFSSVIIRDRLSAIRSLQPPGAAPRLITACVPGELHEIGILIVSILALRRGCHVTHLSGSPSPLGLCRAVEQLRPEVVLLSSTTPESLAAALPAIARLAEAARELRRPPQLIVGGQGVQHAGVLPEVPGVRFTADSAESVLGELVPRGISGA